MKKRPMASKEEDTGTNEEFEKNLKAREEREKGKLTRDKIERFVAS